MSALRNHVAALAALPLCLLFLQGTSAGARTRSAAPAASPCEGQALRVGAARFRIVHLRVVGPTHVGRAGQGELVRCTLALGRCPEPTPPGQPHLDCVVQQETRTGLHVSLARLKGIAARVALGHRSQRRVIYVSGNSCAAARGDAALLGCLRDLRKPSPSPGAAAPPAAYLIRGSRIVALARGSYCWGSGNPSLCADVVAPWQRGDIPRVVLRSGELVRFRLGFQPSELHVTLLTRAGPVQSVRLPAQAMTTWQVPLLPDGSVQLYLSLFARTVSGPATSQSPRGDADYVARVERAR